MIAQSTNVTIFPWENSSLAVSVSQSVFFALCSPKATKRKLYPSPTRGLRAKKKRLLGRLRGRGLEEGALLRLHGLAEVTWSRAKGGGCAHARSLPLVMDENKKDPVRQWVKISAGPRRWRCKRQIRQALVSSIYSPNSHTQTHIYAQNHAHICAIGTE